MVLYLVIQKKTCYIFGYSNWIEKKFNGSGPDNLLATTSGYEVVSKTTEQVFVSPSTYHLGYCSSETKEIEKVLSEFDLTHLVVTGDYSSDFYTYLKIGESIDGYKDRDFKDHKVVKALMAITVKDYTSVAEKFLPELKRLSKLHGDKYMLAIGDPKYWNPKRNTLDYFVGNQLVSFSDLKYIDNKRLYVCTNVKDKDADEIGKPAKSINYTISLGVEVDAIERPFNALEEHLGTMKVPALVNLSNLYNKDTVRCNKIDDTLTLKKYFNSITVENISGLAQGICFIPPGLMFKFQSSIKEVLNAQPHCTSVDITDAFYNDKKLLPHVTNGYIYKYILDGNVLAIELGIDTLTRNQLKRFEKKDIKITLMYIVIKSMIKYYTRIDVDGIVLISYAPYNNTVYKKGK